ncbi:MAG: DUF4129 domain-containing protein [Bifidobacteriaceae bacterium]|nr:DUF4129 domain-containing protein [Bifidobacteriaceae bacterium]
MIRAALLFPREVPVTPGADEARRELLEELSKPEYQQGFNPIAWLLRWVADRLSETEGPAIGHQGWIVLLLIAVGVAAIIVIARIVGGPIRRGEPAKRPRRGVLEDEHRSAAELRKEAEALALRQDWTRATLTRFRALARSLDDRSIIDASPGQTAEEIASAAAVRLPGLGDRLAQAALLFDVLAYSDKNGDQVSYTLMSQLDRDVLRATPVRSVRKEVAMP